MDRRDNRKFLETEPSGIFDIRRETTPGEIDEEEDWINWKSCKEPLGTLITSAVAVSTADCLQQRPASTKGRPRKGVQNKIANNNNISIVKRGQTGKDRPNALSKPVKSKMMKRKAKASAKSLMKPDRRRIAPQQDLSDEDSTHPFDKVELRGLSTSVKQAIPSNGRNQRTSAKAKSATLTKTAGLNRVEEEGYRRPKKNFLSREPSALAKRLSSNQNKKINNNHKNEQNESSRGTINAIESDDSLFPDEEPGKPFSIKVSSDMPGQSYECPNMKAKSFYYEKNGQKVWICLVCMQTEHEMSTAPMICCDHCDDWYHFDCVGIKESPPDDLNWYCKRCIYRYLSRKAHYARQNSCL